ncbi:MAG: cytidylate kinase-like family protein [Gemmataceae bacterium]
MTPPPLHGFRGDLGVPLVKPRGMTIAITREAGARGGSIAQRVAKRLGWQLFDHEMLDYLIRDNAACKQLLAELPPGAAAWADHQLKKLIDNLQIAAGSETAELMRLMLSVAARGDSVIVGRGAGFVLPIETTIHVRIVAPIEERIAFMSQMYRLTRDEATEEVKIRDERRIEFLSTLFPEDVIDPYRYDLILNSSRLGEAETAEIIVHALQAKMPSNSPGDPFLPDEDRSLSLQ